MSRIKTYIVVAEDKEHNYHTDYVQAISSQDAVDTLYSEARDEYNILTVAVVVNNWK